ncbi:hypothetical protein TW81_12010 [Vibrio galatheae]|uniref:Phosphofructokinase n=1 Tax=Vibrio galatheae TaxID=579748 RepID=A0A0F4NJ14_9VIBR|nr:1-phosphofructokinase [Vibrio galatheae]KJY82919.1 hypothetical protein TW81_12010 [Vibrio galatheae]
MKVNKWVTVTLNPAIDLSAQAQDLALNQVNSVQETKRYAAGKGINVGKVLSDLGASVTLSGFLGRHNSKLFETFFASNGLNTHFVMVDGTNRTNIKIHDTSGGTTDINFNGFRVEESDIAALHKTILELATDHDGFIFAGSLPENLSEHIVVGWIEELKQLGKKVVLDSSKKMLCAGIKAKPWLVKPNETEISDYLGRKVESMEEAVDAASELVEQGIDNVIVSLGEKGLIWATQRQVLIAQPPKLTPVSTVGAGDSVVAGFCWASQFDNPERQVASATAIGALAVSQTGVGVGSLDALDAMLKQVFVREYVG